MRAFCFGQFLADLGRFLADYWQILVDVRFFFYAGGGRDLQYLDQESMQKS